MWEWSGSFTSGDKMGTKQSLGAKTGTTATVGTGGLEHAFQRVVRGPAMSLSPKIVENANFQASHDSPSLKSRVWGSAN